MSDKRRPVLTYDPACLHCRRDAGKDSAGVTRLCETHKDAELAKAKQTLKTERRFTNDYIKALHKAERQLAEAVALLKECRTQVIHADSTLSAYGHGRVITKTEALEQSSRLRNVTARLDAFLTGVQYSPSEGQS